MLFRSVPSMKVAVEYNGLYWHMDKGDAGFKKTLHYDKTVKCRELGIKLIHIFSDDWHTKQNLIKSMIKNSLGVMNNKINARQCEIVELTNKEAKPFFDDSHISGHAKASKIFALKNNGEIVCALSGRTPFHKKYTESIELGRFAT